MNGPLVALADAARWVAWRLDTPDGRQPTKVPYAPGSGMARANDAATWGTLAAAQAAAAALPDAKGVGVMLGIHDGYALSGLDLDTCRDAGTGAIEAWASDMIARFSTYAEVSPSGTGIKLFFKYAAADLPQLLQAMGTAGGKQFKRKGYGTHPPAIELYLAVRWFAVTAKPAPGSSGTLALVPTAALLQLVQRDGPAFADKAAVRPVAAVPVPTPAPVPADGVWQRVVALADARPPLARLLAGDLASLSDQSRSGMAMSLGGQLRRAGFSMDDMTAALRSWEHTAAWCEENGPRALQRIWDAAAPAPGSEFGALDPTRRKIVVRPNNLAEQIAAAEAALIASGQEIYQRGGAVVRSGLVSERTGKGGHRDALRLIEVGETALHALFDRAAVWVRFDARAKAETPCRCPLDVPRAYLSSCGIGWRLPVLAGVVHAPTLRHDGTVIEALGYDETTGLLFDARGVTFPAVLAQPTRDDTRAALAVLAGLLAEFPFVAEQDRAVAISLLLTGLVRRSLATAPMHALTAPTPGTGKSHLADVAALIATGYRAPGVGWVRDNDHENAKVLDAALLAGGPVLALDNITGELQSARLNALLSQEEVKIRILGTPREVTVACNALVIANGNNLQLAADMTRRVVLCRLDARMESPEDREFHGDPVAAVQADRGKYVVAGLTVLRAYHLAGSPDRPRPLAGFNEWSDLVRGALLWLGQADPVASMAAVREGDPRRSELQAVLAHWDMHIGPDRTTTAQLIAKAVAVNEFREALLAVAGAGGAVNTRRLGVWLREQRGKIVGGLSVEAGGTKDGSTVWRLIGGKKAAGIVVPFPSAHREALNQLLQ